jgi:peptidoglycan hydrolase-like amidase
MSIQGQKEKYLFILQRISTIILVVVTLFVILSTKTLSNFFPALQYNPYNECPPNATANNMIWVLISSNYSPTGQEIFKQIPFDTGTITYMELIHGTPTQVEYDNYIRGVLVGELGNAEPLPGGNRWQPEMLKAMAVAIRTKAYVRCGWIEYNGIKGIQGEVTQEYRYTRVMPDVNINVSEETHQDFQDAVDATQSIHLQYQGQLFDLEYRNRTGIETGGDTPPHKGVYDPVGEPFESDVNNRQTGLPQINANYWALGDSQGTPFPRWNYLQILVHYYTGIEVVKIN